MVWQATHPENCIQYEADTHYPFEDISCLLTHDASLKYLAPLAKTYMDWEYTTRLEAPSWNAVIGAVVGSAVIMLVGNLMMYRKRPFQIRSLVTCWNVFWMGIHFLGFVRLLPLVVHNFVHYSVKDNVCGPAQSLWLSGTTGLWSVIWLYIKMTEVLLESVLVVLLQQSCGLLQWFNNYAYVLLHSYVLYTSKIPGGSGVICVYYGIVGLMNCYCFYLNWNKLPQPDKPTALLDCIHLVQTMSGVFLTVVTLHYWKDAVYNHRTCDANEPHIRIMAFAWSGGHVLIACLNLLQNSFVKSQQEKQIKRLREEKANRNKEEGKKSKGVTFAPGAKKSKSDGKGENTPELVEESTSSTDELLTKKQKLRKRNKTVPKNIEVQAENISAEGKKTEQEAAKKESSSTTTTEPPQEKSTSKKKKKKKNNKKKDD